jgi:hypothetical protein
MQFSFESGHQNKNRIYHKNGRYLYFQFRISDKSYQSNVKGIHQIFNIFKFYYEGLKKIVTEIYQNNFSARYSADVQYIGFTCGIQNLENRTVSAKVLLWRIRRLLTSLIVSSGIWSMRNWTALVFSDDGTEYSIVALEDSCDYNPSSISKHQPSSVHPQYRQSTIGCIFFKKSVCYTCYTCYTYIGHTLFAKINI